jgi:hypothetical protein
MTIEPAAREARDAYMRLAESAAIVRYHHEHYLDGFTAGGPADVRAGGGGPQEVLTRAAGDLFGAVTALTAGHPWALGSFGDRDWDSYRPARDAPACTAGASCSPKGTTAG